jgi:hypothetical protein
MACQQCGARGVERSGRKRRTRRRTARCSQCGAPLPTVSRLVPGTRGETAALLARFGLAITGDPLLELKREDV